jgi:hypothetical protein
MVRDILNSNGDKIGEMELPDDTSEERWAEALSPYAIPVIVELEDVSPRQIRQALVLSGITMSSINAALDTLPEPQKDLAHIAWEFSQIFIRSEPLVNAVGQMLGWTSEQLDDLWKLAATL